MIKRCPALLDCLRATLLEVGVRSKGPDVDVVTVNMRLRGALIDKAQVETSVPPYGSAARA